MRWFTAVQNSLCFTFSLYSKRSTKFLYRWFKKRIYTGFKIPTFKGIKIVIFLEQFSHKPI